MNEDGMEQKRVLGREQKIDWEWKGEDGRV
jgi:hypothetical protein